MMSKAKGWSWLVFGFKAIVVHALGIAIFIAASRSAWGHILKPIALAGTLGADVALLAWIFNRSARVQSIFVSALYLSGSYVLAFHLVGAVAFGGLLRDVGTGPAYFASLLRVSAATLLLFTICSATVFGALTLQWRTLLKLSKFRWLAVVLLSALASLLSVTSSCSSACGNNLVREVPEPGGSFKLAIFERDCGATTGFVTHIALLRKNDSLSNATVGDIFVADANHGAASRWTWTATGIPNQE